MFGYSPRVTHFFMPMIIFAIAEAARQSSWTVFGFVMYGLGALVVFVILYAFISEIHYNTREDRTQTPRDDDNDDDDIKREASTTHVVISDGRGHMKLFDLPASPRQLEQLATGLLIANDGFTQRRWSGRGRPFSRSQFEILTSTMIEKGLAHQVNPEHPQQGYALTVIGKQFLRKHLPHSPTLEEFPPETGDASHARTDTRTDAFTTT